MPRPRFDQAEFARTLERVVVGEDFSSVPMQPAFDEKLHREVVEEFTHGRRIDDYRQVLEHWGFEFVPSHRLDPYPDGRPHAEGEWRSARLRLAFTDNDILSAPEFRKPEMFDRWIRRLLHRRKLARLGLVR